MSRIVRHSNTGRLPFICLLILLGTLVMPSSASSQDVSNLMVGEHFSVAFMPPDRNAPAGLALAYRVYLNDTVVAEPTAATGAVEHEVPMEPIQTAGDYRIRVGARYVVTNPARWLPCPSEGCLESFVELPLTVGAAPVPEPPQPGPVRIIRIETTVKLAPDGEILDVQTRTVRK